MSRSFIRTRHLAITVVAVTGLVACNTGLNVPNASTSTSDTSPLGALPDAAAGRAASALGDITLDQAVARGRLAREVVDAVSVEPAEALVLVDQLGVIAEVSRSTPLGSPERITAMAERFSAHKRAVFGRMPRDVVVVTDFELLPSALVRVGSLASLQQLVNDPEVAQVSANRPIPAASMDQESTSLVRQPDVVAKGYTGAGTYTAVLDTGVDYSREDFGSCADPSTSCRVVIAADAAPDDGVLDTTGHGTNVSGIVAGMAPATKLIVYDVFTGTSAYPASIDQAMTRLLDLKRQGYAIAAVNLSLGYGSYTSSTCPSDSISLATVRAAGILPVIASGNDVSTAGVGWPACLTDALSVGAVYDGDNGGWSYQWPDGTLKCTDEITWADKVTCFSQSGPNLKMLAPGASISAAGIQQSGTSQAAPHVAGAAALLAAARPSASPPELEAALTRNGTKVVDRDGVSRTRLDVVAALNALLSTDSAPPNVTPPSPSLTFGTTLSKTATVTVYWTASDRSGITAYDLYSSTNGQAWTREALSTPTATSKAFSLTPGTQYQFTVAARDGAGNWSNYVPSAAFRVANFPENSTYVKYSSGWSRLAWSAANGGYVQVSSTTGAKATFTFTGRSIAWVASVASNRGAAYVYVDNAYMGRIDLYGTTSQASRLVYTSSWGTSATHTITIVVVGTSGRPTIDIDSLLLLG